MCFSFPVTLVLVFLGLALTKYRLQRKEFYHASIVFFYTSMELLQTAQYLVLNSCNEINYWLTVCAHFLIIVQPALWNYFRYKTCEQNKAIFLFSVKLSLVWAAFFTLRLYPFSFSLLNPELDYEDILTGSEVCTFSGPSHLFWSLPYYSYGGLEANLFTYLLLWFYPALYERSGEVKLLIWLSQIVLIYNLVTLSKELPSFWCALSVPFLILCSFIY
jgi:hypothetical protein